MFFPKRTKNHAKQDKIQIANFVIIFVHKVPPATNGVKMCLIFLDSDVDLEAVFCFLPFIFIIQKASSSISVQVTLRLVAMKGRFHQNVKLDHGEMVDQQLKLDWKNFSCCMGWL